MKSEVDALCGCFLGKAPATMVGGLGVRVSVEGAWSSPVEKGDGS